MNGFLESGKTSFIKTTLEDPEFLGKDRLLLLVCEEGMEEYDEESLKKQGIAIEYVEDREDFTLEFLEQCQNRHHPDKVIIELNGVWKMEDFLEMDTPADWITVQIITLVNAGTFSNYINNMRSMIMEHLKYSDTIIFNRCTADTNRLEIRRTIKPVNRKAQIIYETEDGIDMGEDEQEVLPFDVNADVITIEDDDFGLWYLDALDYPGKYEGKTVEFKAMFYKDKNMPKDYFVPGRFAMQCCANDIAFIGFMTRFPMNFKGFIESHSDRQWIKVSAQVRVEFRREYRGKGPVLCLKSIEDAAPAEEEIVYFT